MTDDIEINEKLDTSGLCCPVPMIRVNESIKKMGAGAVVELIATDSATRRDIPSWCERTGHRLLSVSFDDDSYQYRYLIRKKGSAE